MIKVGNQSDLEKKKLPTSNSETSDLCKPTTTTEEKKNSQLKKSLTYILNYSRTDLKKTQFWKKNRKAGCSFQIVEPFLLQIVAPILIVFWWCFFVFSFSGGGGDFL
jgi:hypothetical protein